MTNIVKAEDKFITEKSMTDVVHNRIISLQSQNAIDMPTNYSFSNALKSAYLILSEQKMTDKKTPVLQGCSQESVANALLDMVVQGLNPSKNQCYFIPYGNQLTLQRSYLGTIALTKRLPGVTDVKGYAIYQADKLELGFDFVTGKTTVKEFIPSTDRDPTKLKGALGLIIGEKDILHVEYMDINQIKAAWYQGSMKGNSGAHKNFSDQMAIKTVINRACKTYVNTADDSDKIAPLMSKSIEVVDNEMQQEIEENAGTLEIEGEIVDVETGEILDTEDTKKAPF
ncbi:recombinase RecT [Microaceticoccus formicicus]|uniref:recombinase RecT n=1 Tax=Microaceticoccus formicicus TaxID=3118105 RepID=UPI003CD01EB7|nr:recombinase RecT [Peptoniphilaceae bacterium AMB_02]